MDLDFWDCFEWQTPLYFFTYDIVNNYFNSIHKCFFFCLFFFDTLHHKTAFSDHHLVFLVVVICDGATSEI